MEIFKKIIFMFLFISFWAVAVWTIFLSDVMRVDQVNVISNANAVDVEDIRREIEMQLNGNYLWFVPKDNLLLIRRGYLKGILNDKYKLIRKISISREFPNGLNVSIEEREVHVGWCSGDKCFLVDERGEAFLEAEKQHIDTIKVVDSSNKVFGLGERVADPEFIFFVEKIAVAIRDELHIEVEDEFVTPSSMSDEVRVRTKEGWEVYFSTSRKIENQTEILKKIVKETVGEQKISVLEYVDLRIKGKAIYKLKGQESNGGEKEEKED